MGTGSHTPDLDFIAPVLTELVKTYSDRIQFRFYGAKPPENLLNLPQMIWSPIKTYQYEEFVSDFQTLDVDIYIAPLVNNIFNQCKSPIKYLELSAQGSAGVYWRNPPYEEVITDGVDGLLASSPDEWYLQLTRLIEDSDLRFNIALKAQETIRNKWLLSQNAFQWSETYNEILKNSSTIKSSATINLDVVQSFSDQLDLYHKKNNGKVSELITKIETNEKAIIELNNQLNEKDKSLTIINKNLSELNKTLITTKNNLSEMEISLSINKKILLEKEKNIKLLRKNLIEKENEILLYSLSKSWQITRPLRKIKNIFKGKRK